MNFVDTSLSGLPARNVLDFLHAIEEKDVRLHSLVVLKKGRTVLDLSWRPYQSTIPHTLYSLSKSFCSLAAGFAVQENLLSWDSRLVDTLREEAPEHPPERLSQITLHHLLSMTSGLDPESDAAARRKPFDWAKEVMTYDVLHAPGTVFHYNSMGTYLISCMVQKVTGQTIRDYLMPRLFAPLGIEKPMWDVSPDGVCFGGYGLHLSAMDMAKFGQLLLQKGQWEGEQLLPEGWLYKATTRQADTSQVEKHPDWASGYGYQFWMTRQNRYRGDGMWGQVMMVDAEQDIVVAMTAATDWMGHQMDALHDHLLAAPKAARPGDTMELTAKARSLCYACFQDDGTGDDFTGAYRGPGGRSLRIDLRSDGLLNIQLAHKKELRPLNALFGKGSAHRGEYQPPAVRGEQTLCALGSFGFENEVLVAQLLMPASPYTWLMRFEKKEDGLLVTIRGAGSDEGERLYTRQGC